MLSVAGKEVRDLAGFFRRIWAQGQAGVEVPMTIYRDGETMELRIKSSERNQFPQGPEFALKRRPKVVCGFGISAWREHRRYGLKL